MKNLILIFTTLLLCASCNKYACEDDNYGSLKFTNKTNKPIKVYINGFVKHTLDPNNYALENLSPGTYTVKAEQVGTTYYWPEIHPAVIQCEVTPLNFQ